MNTLQSPNGHWCSMVSLLSALMWTTITWAQQPPKLPPYMIHATNNPLACILGRTEIPPDVSCIARLGIKDQAKLVREWKRRKGIPSRLNIAFALAWLGTDEAATTLTKTFEDFGGQPKVFDFKVDYEGSFGLGLMRDYCLAMGVCAQKSDKMFSYLLKCTNAMFILESRRWTAIDSNTTANVAALLAGCAVESLGMSMRPDAQVTLNSMRLRGPVIYAPGLPSRTVDSSVYYAMLYLHASKSLNRDELMALPYWLNDVEVKRIKSDWETTPEGKDWSEWHQSFQPRKEPDAVPPTSLP